MSLTEIPPDEILPCGCILRCSVVEGVNTLTYIPCRESCAHYKDTLRLAVADGVPIERTYGP